MVKGSGASDRTSSWAARGAGNRACIVETVEVGTPRYSNSTRAASQGAVRFTKQVRVVENLYTCKKQI